MTRQTQPAPQIAKCTLIQEVLRSKQMWKSIAENLKMRARKRFYVPHIRPILQEGAILVTMHSCFQEGTKCEKSVDRMSLPTQSTPGAFRGNSESGKPPQGNININNFDLSRPTTSDRPSTGADYEGGIGAGINSSMEMYRGSKTDYPAAPFHKSDRKSSDMSFMGAQVAGGGFNQRDGGALRMLQ